mmetsp:Transcript_1339/g.5093  ORF Transcript_1339/g.5093 Transcript_1339/m.5093 type:complete len:437 (+) Transcript_1339:220-1530(+)
MPVPATAHPWNTELRRSSPVLPFASRTLPLTAPTRGTSTLLSCSPELTQVPTSFVSRNPPSAATARAFDSSFSFRAPLISASVNATSKAKSAVCKPASYPSFAAAYRSPGASGSAPSAWMSSTGVSATGSSTPAATSVASFEPAPYFIATTSRAALAPARYATRAIARRAFGDSYNAKSSSAVLGSRASFMETVCKPSKLKTARDPSWPGPEPGDATERSTAVAASSSTATKSVSASVSTSAAAFCSSFAPCRYPSAYAAWYRSCSFSSFFVSLVADPAAYPSAYLEGSFKPSAKSRAVAVSLPSSPASTPSAKPSSYRSRTGWCGSSVSGVYACAFTGSSLSFVATSARVTTPVGFSAFNALEGSSVSGTGESVSASIWVMDVVCSAVSPESSSIAASTSAVACVSADFEGGVSTVADDAVGAAAGGYTLSLPYE